MKGESERSRPGKPTFEALEPRLLLDGSISGQIWHDLNGDGIRDVGDTGLDGWTVELADVASGTVVDTQITASVDVDGDGTIDPQAESGLYTFAGVATGDYVVRSPGMATWSQTAPMPTPTFSMAYVQTQDWNDAQPISEARHLVESPDGLFVYTVGGSNSTSDQTQPYDGIVAFSRDPATGVLTPVQSIFDDGTNALDMATFIVISSDGLYAYTTSYHDDSLGVYTRDVVTGQLTHLQTLYDGQDGIDTLWHPSTLAVSPDGDHLYVNGRTVTGDVGALTTFTRDAATGLLSLQGVLRDGQDGLNMSGLAEPVLSQDGQFLYVSDFSSGLNVFMRDQVTGELTFVEAESVGSAERCVMSPSGRHVYVSGWSGGDRVIKLFARDAVTGSLTFVESSVAGQDSIPDLGELGPLEMSPDGLYVLAKVSSYEEYLAFSRDEISGHLTFVDMTNIDGPDNYYIHDILISSDGHSLYALPTYYNSSLMTLSCDYTTPSVRIALAGADTFVGVDFGYVPPVTSISGQVFADRNADGAHDTGEFGLNGWTVELLDAGGLVVDTQITRPIDSNGDYILDVDTEHGAYEFSGMLPGDYEVRQVAQAGWAQTTTPAAHAVSIAYGPVTTGIDFGNVGYGGIAGQVWYDLDRDGIQDAGEDGRDGVTVELIDVVTGSVVDTQVTASDDLDGSGTIDPHTEAGRYSFAGVVTGDYTVRPAAQPGWDYTGPLVATGELEQAQVEVMGGYYPDLNSVVATNDGAYVYVVNGQGDSVIVLARDAATDELSGIQILTDGVDGMVGLDYTQNLILSVDEAQLYVVAGDGVILVFQRDVATGLLTLAQTVMSPASDASVLAVSDDGKNVYVGGYHSNSVTVFARDAITGELSFVQDVDAPSHEGQHALNHVTGVAVSSNGAHVYVTAYSADTLVVFARDQITGELTLVEILRDGYDGIVGLRGAYDVTVSDDGAFVYATSFSGGSVVTFARDAATGKLNPAQRLYTGNYAVSIALSPDNSHVYVGRRGGGAVLVYDRSESTGELTLLQTLADGVDGVDGLDGMTSVFVSGDGAYVYSTSDRDDALAVFERLEAALPVSVTVSVGGVVAVESLGVSDTVTVSGQVFADRNTDGLHDVGDFGLDGWTVELVDTSGAVAATQVSAGVDVNDDGTIDPDTEAGRYSFDSVVPGDYEVRQMLQVGWTQTTPVAIHLISPLASQDVTGLDFGNIAYGGVAGQLWEDIDGNGQRDAGELGADGVTVELVDTANGAVAATAVTFSDDLDGSGAIDPQTEMGLYNFTGIPIGSYEVRPDATGGWVQTNQFEWTGELHFVQNVEDGVGGVDGLDGANSVAVSADGAHIYVTSYTDNSVATFARDAVTGELSFVQVLKDGVDGVDGLDRAQSVAISGDGANVYAVGAYDDALTVFSRDAVTGELSFVQVLKDGVGGVDGLDGPYSVAVSGDGAHVYVAGVVDDALAVFARDAVTGELSFVQVLKDGVDGVDGLDGAYSVAVSGDGAHVYAGAITDDAVAVFARDAATGQLSFVQVVKDGVGGVDGLNSAESVTISGDGAHVYVAGSNDDAVAVFARDTATGELSFVQALKDGVDGVDGLDGVRSLTVSADGAFVYAASHSDRAVAVFARDAITGELSFVHMLKARDAADWIYGVFGVAVSGDGAHVYAVGASDDALAVFEQIHVVPPLAVSLEVTVDAVTQGVDLCAADGVAVSGQVFGDLNDDGIHDAAERGQDGRVILLLDAFTGRLLDTRVTASIDLDGNGVIDPISESGLYSFTDLPPRQYKAKLVSDGWTQTTPAGPHWLNISSGDADIAGRDFGVFATASVSGQVFADRNSDGLHDTGDFGLSGWTVELVDADTGVVVASQIAESIDVDGDTIIDPDIEEGLYSFTDVAPGNYEVRQVLPAGWVRTVPAGPQAVFLDVGRSVTAIDFGAIAFGSVTGQVWEDTSGDGVQDAGEVGVDSMTVELIDAAGGAVVATQVTASVDLDGDGAIDPQTEAGLYSFSGVPVGGYQVRPASGWVITSPIVATGQLGPVQIVQEVSLDGVRTPLDGVRTLVISNDGKDLYAALAYGDAIAVFARDAATGELQIVQTLSNGDGGLTLNGVAAIAISSDDAHVYVAAYQDDVLLVFARDAVTGELSFVQSLTDNVDGVDGLQTVYELTVSDDGLHVYTAAYNDNAISVFARDTITGELTFVQMLREGVDGIDSLGGVYSLTVSSDGAHVYAGSLDDDAITVFARDAVTGQLSLVQTVWDGVDGVTGLDGANSVVISDDGAHLYTTGRYSNSIVLFDRDAVTGELSFVQCLTDGIGGVDGLATAQSPAISADGALVYVPAPGEDAVSVFSRDAVTGELDLLNVVRDGVDGIDGLDWAIFAAVVDDDVYVAGLDDDAIAVFEAIYAPGPVDVTVTADEIVTDVDLGVIDPVTVTGQVFADADNDGVRDAAEVGQDGWTVELVRTDTGDVVATRVTASVDVDEDGTIDPVTETGL